MTSRTDARVAGAAYLLYIVCTMTSSILFAGILTGHDPAQKLVALSRALPMARVTVLLDLLQTVWALTLAATLYRLVNTVDATVALLAMLFRVGEGLLGFLPLLDKLELLNLAKNPAMASANATLADTLLKRPDDGFAAFCFVIGGFLFACLFLKGRLIPRWLAWIGVVTIGVQMVCVPLHIAGLVPGSVVEAMWMSILLYEVPLGLWLIVKGTRDPAALSPALRAA